MPHFLILSHGADAAGTTDDPALDEAHWSYMDRFAPGMIARGPTLTADRARWTGGLHVVDLENAVPARAFADDEPYNRAGLYVQHRIWRFGDLLGRTMWAFVRAPGEPLYLVTAPEPGSAAPDVTGSLGARLAMCGELASTDGLRPAVFALGLQAPDRTVVEAMLRDAGVTVTVDRGIEILDWEFGGRR